MYTQGISNFDPSVAISNSLCHLFQVDLMPPENLCVFSMLTQLELGLVSVDILLALLQKTPVLKTLVIKVRNY